MNRNNLLYLILCLCGIVQSFSQTQDTIYYDRNWNVTSKKLAGYYRVENKITTKDTSYWEFKDRFIDNDQVQNEGFYTKKNPETRQGLWTWYYPNGKKEMEGLYHKNNRLGKWTFYYNDGAVKKSGEYVKKGKQNGEWTWFHPDGSLMSKVSYKEDTLTGKRIVLHENGKKRIEEYYLKGKLDSIQTEWFSTGQIKSQVNYKRGFKNGTEKIWYMDGTLKSEIQYSSGIAKNEKWFNMQGDSVAKDSVVQEKEFHNLLWKISGNGLEKPSYLFGTMHVKDKRAFEFSDSMLIAFNESEGYSMEIHPDSLYSYYFKQFDKYKTWQHFGVEVLGYQEADEYFEDWGQEYGSYQQWIMNLNQIFHRDDYKPDGMPYFVDCYLYYIATKHGKYTSGIESVEDHVNAGKNLPKNSMRYDILSKFDPEEEMLLTYQEGDLKRINALMEFLQDEEFRYRLLTLRNTKMATSIDSLAKIRPTFNTAGTAHLPGKDGVIELLKNKGYTLSPVKAIFSGDTLDDKKNTPKTIWTRVRPFNADFTIESPGTLTSFSNGVVRNIHLDPIKEIGLDAYQLNEKWFSSGTKSNKIEKSDINYLFNSPDDFKTEKIKHLKINGLEVTWKELNETSSYGMRSIKSNKTEKDKQYIYHRAHVFKENFQTYVVQVASSNEDSLKSSYCEHFLNSIVWDKEEKQQVNWTELNDSIGAFRVQTPSNVTKQFIHYNSKEDADSKDQEWAYSYHNSRDLEHKINYWTSTDNGNEFIVRYNNSPNGKWFYEDKNTFNWGLDYYLSFIPNLKDSTFSKFGDYPMMNAKIKANKKHLVYYKYINRGYRNYLLIAKTNKSKESKEKVDKFFNSFEFTDFTSMKYTNYFTSDSIKLVLPFPIEKQSLTSRRDFIPKRNGPKKQYRYSYDYDSDDELYSKNSWTSYLSNPIKDEKIVEAFKSRHKFYAIDTTLGITYQTYVETFSEYFYIPNQDTLFDMFQESFTSMDYKTIDTTNSFYIQNNDTIHYRHLNFNIKGQNGTGQLRFTNKGQSVIIQRVFYPIELKENNKISNYFNSLDLSKVKDTLNLFADKSKSILDSLSSKDSLQQVYARKALLFYPFDSTHVPLIYSALEKELTLKGKKEENNALDLVNLLSYINDSTTSTYIYNLSKTNFRDSLTLRIDFLKAFRSIDSKKSLDAYLDLIQDPLVKVKDNSYKYKSILNIFEDSIQVFANNHKHFNHWMKDTVWSIETRILEMTLSAIKNSKIQNDSIYKNTPFIREHFIWVANSFKNIKKDSAVYQKVKDNLIEYTELINLLNINDDRLDSIMLTIFKEKDSRLHFSAAKYLFKSQEALSEKDRNKLFKPIKTRYELIQLLYDIQAPDRIPEEYRNREAIAEAQLYKALENESEYNSTPINFKLLKIVTEKVNGEKKDFYVFSYYESGYGRTKLIGVSNPLPHKKESNAFYNKLYVSTEDFSSSKKAIKNIISDWIYEYGYIQEDSSENINTYNHYLNYDSSTSDIILEEVIEDVYYDEEPEEEEK